MTDRNAGFNRELHVPPPAPAEARRAALALASVCGGDRDGLLLALHRLGLAVQR